MSIYPSTFTGSATPEPTMKPFMIEHLQLDKQLSGYFRPGAQMVITPELRTSGVLHALGSEDLKTFLFVLTFLTRNGHCTPSLQELAHAMHVSEAKARSRLRRLVEVKWQEEPLVVEVERPNGVQSFVPSPPAVGRLRERAADRTHEASPLVRVAAKEAV